MDLFVISLQSNSNLFTFLLKVFQVGWSSFNWFLYSFNISLSLCFLFVCLFVCLLVWLIGWFCILFVYLSTLLFSKNKTLKLIMHFFFFCPSLRIFHFSQEFWFLLLNNDIRNQSLGTT